MFVNYFSDQLWQIPTFIISQTFVICIILISYLPSQWPINYYVAVLDQIPHALYILIKCVCLFTMHREPDPIQLYSANVGHH